MGLKGPSWMLNHTVDKHEWTGFKRHNKWAAVAGSRGEVINLVFYGHIPGDKWSYTALTGGNRWRIQVRHNAGQLYQLHIHVIQTLPSPLASLYHLKSSQPEKQANKKRFCLLTVEDRPSVRTCSSVPAGAALWPLLTDRLTHRAQKVLSSYALLNSTKQELYLKAPDVKQDVSFSAWTSRFRTSGL